MKKIIYIAISAFALASCSNDSEEIANKEDGLTPVTIGAETGLSSTRATWQLPQTDADDGKTKMAVLFKPGETLDVYESGYEGAQTFTDVDPSEYQSANFAGAWHENGTRWAAVLPSGSANSVEVSETGCKYNLTLPDEQTTLLTKYVTEAALVENTTYTVSPDTKANIMVGAKDSHNTATCFMSPICAYLYFATSTNIKTVKVKSTNSNQPLAGNILVYTGENSKKAGSYEWDGWENFVNCITTITKTSNLKSEITVEGQTVPRTVKGVTSNYNEYVVAIFPQTYDGIEITTTDGTFIAKTSGTTNKFDIVNVYYLGYFDTSK